LACKNYDEGGIRAPNIALEVEALHGTWIARFCKPGVHGWKTFMAEELAMAESNIHCLTGNFSPNIDKNRKTIFASAIRTWSKITKPFNPKKIEQILEASIWMNADICTSRGSPLRDRTRGHTLIKIKDLLNDTGHLATFDELRRKGLPQGDFLTWMSIMTCIKKSWKKQIEQHAKNKSNNLATDDIPNICTPEGRTSELTGPAPPAENRDCIGVGSVDEDLLNEQTTIIRNAITDLTRNGKTPDTPKADQVSTGVEGGSQQEIPMNNANNSQLTFINDKPTVISKMKCKDIYKILINNLKHEMQPFRSRMTPIHNLSDCNWSTLYSTPFLITTSTKIRSFHVRLTHGLLYGNKQLNKFGYKEESNCQLCTTPLQTFQHLMIECEAIADLWRRIEREFSNIFEEPLSNTEKELGCVEKEDEYFISKNLLLLIVRRYIYQCNIDGTNPTYAGVISYLRMHERIEYAIASRSDAVEKHFLKWEEILNSLHIGTPI